MAFTSNGAHRIHWQSEGDGTPVLLIMGHQYSSRMWYPVIPALAPRHRVLSFDNRGTGESGAGTGFTIADMARDALAVMDAAGVDRAHVYGVSMGGGIAQELAVLAPDRVLSLVLGCTAIQSAEKPRLPGVARALYFIPKPLWRALMRRGDGYGSRTTPERRAEADGVLAGEVTVTSSIAAQAKAVATYMADKDDVARMTMPALVMHGDEDSVVPYAYGVELADTLPNSRMVTFDGAAHNFIVANPELANSEVLEFLDEVDAREYPAAPPVNLGP